MLTPRQIRVLVIDDDEDDFFIISDYIHAIQKDKFIVHWCNNYQVALEKIKAREYDIYFVDYRLGNRTGLELLQEVHSDDFYDPVVLLTGKGNKEIDIKAMQSGATDYLVKSDLNTEKLERCMRYSLEQSAALKELKARETRYRNLFEGSKDAVFIADMDANFLEVNHAASLLFGYGMKDLLMRRLYDFVKGKEHRKDIRLLLKEKNPVTDMEISVVNRDKEIRACLFSASFQKGPEDWLVHGIIHDITNIKKAESANIQAQKLAANERLMRLLAHEIRNPLNNISLSIEHFQLPFKDTEQQKNLVNIIRRNSNRINQIIIELLNLTKPGELQFEKHSLQDILNESIASAADRISLRNIRVRKKYPEAPMEMNADKSKLRIAFANILINAVEAMETDKGVLDVSMVATPEAYTVSIRDNGSGIPEENLPKLFEPFFTLKKNGMGLGLAASYSIIQSHKGRIQVDSKVNEGTNFIISFQNN